MENVSATEEGREGETDGERVRFIKGKGVNERFSFDKSESTRGERPRLALLHDTPGRYANGKKKAAYRTSILRRNLVPMVILPF